MSTEIKVMTEHGNLAKAITPTKPIRWIEESLDEFCKSFDLWELTVDETLRNFIVPMSKNERCRFVDLLIMKRREGGLVNRRAAT